VGAKVDVSDLDLSLVETDIHLKDVQIANPSDPEQNICEATDVVLDLDRGAFVQRQLVVREGRISGLRFSTDRETSGQLASRTEQEDDAEKDDAGSRFDAKWLRMFSDRMSEDLQEDLETIRVSRELMARWPEEYRQIESRADALVARIRRLREAIDRARQGDVLRDPRMIQQARADLDAARKDIELLPDEVRRLRDIARRDRDAIKLAKQHDVEFLKQRFRMDAFDAETLSRYLLRDEEAAQVRELLAWIEWGRKFVPEKRKLSEPERGRGWRIRFRGLPRQPDWLFERLVLDGVATRNGQPMPFSGELRDVTWQQHIVGRPTTLDIQVAGATPLSIRAMLDRTTAEPFDRFLVECPSLQFEQRTLGQEDSLSLTVAPSQAAVRLEMELRGDTVDGQLVYRQDRLDIRATAPDGQLSQQLVRRLNQAASEIKQTSVTVSLDGQLPRPRLHLKSDLGTQLSAGFHQAFQDELNDRANQLRGKLDQFAEKHLAEVQQRVDAKVQDLLARLNGPREEIAELAQLLPSAKSFAGSLGLPNAVRRASFPWQDTLRR
jgi:uncharacterized protein (TIGR03545 family)